VVCRGFVHSSADDDAPLDHDPLRLSSGINSVPSTVKPNSGQTWPVEAHRNYLGKSHEIVVADVARNTTYMERRHVCDEPVDAHTTAAPRTNTATRKRSDPDGECLTSANGVWED